MIIKNIKINNGYRIMKQVIIIIMNKKVLYLTNRLTITHKSNKKIIKIKTKIKNKLKQMN